MDFSGDPAFLSKILFLVKQNPNSRKPTHWFPYTYAVWIPATTPPSDKALAGLLFDGQHVARTL